MAGFQNDPYDPFPCTAIPFILAPLLTSEGCFPLNSLRLFEFRFSLWIAGFINDSKQFIFLFHIKGTFLSFL